jgi:hypothetical protein
MRTRKTVLDYFVQPARSGSVSSTSTITDGTDDAAEVKKTVVEDSFPPVDAARSAHRPHVHFTPLNEPTTPPPETASTAKPQESRASTLHEPIDLHTTSAAQTAKTPTTPTTPSLPPLSTTLLPMLNSLPESSLVKVRTLLTNHDLRVQGIVMGREIARSAVKAREQKIEELERELSELRH